MGQSILYDRIVTDSRCLAKYSKINSSYSQAVLTKVVHDLHVLLLVVAEDGDPVHLAHHDAHHRAPADARAGHGRRRRPGWTRRRCFDPVPPEGHGRMALSPMEIPSRLK